MKINKEMISDAKLIKNKSSKSKLLLIRKLLKNKYNLTNPQIKCVIRLCDLCAECGSAIQPLSLEQQRHIFTEENINHFFLKKIRKDNIIFCCESCYDKKIKTCNIHLHKNKTYKKISNSLNKFKTTTKAKELYTKVGKTNSVKLKHFFQTPQGKKQIHNNSIIMSKIMIEKIKNGEFKPAITNTFTHWESFVIVNDKKIYFRSSWEACFWLCHQNFEYETVRIPWTDNTSKSRNYIADFYDRQNNIIYEIKPKKFFIKQKQKMDCIINYCMYNNIKFIWINEYNIMDYLDVELFLEEPNKIQYQMLLKGIKYQ